MPEVLVTIALVAVLAAVVVPTVANQVKKGEPNRIAQDITNIRGAIEQFLSDVRKYPRSLGQLTNTIATTGTGMNPLTSSATYSQADVNRWKGPYLTKDSVAVRATGFGMSFTCAAPCTTGWLSAATNPIVAASSFDTLTLGVSGFGRAAGIKYLIMYVGSTDSTSMGDLDAAADDGVMTTGNIRFNKDSGLKILLMPIQP